MITTPKPWTPDDWHAIATIASLTLIGLALILKVC
jgi:hypothetical protein